VSVSEKTVSVFGKNGERFQKNGERFQKNGERFRKNGERFPARVKVPWRFRGAEKRRKALYDKVLRRIA